MKRLLIALAVIALHGCTDGRNDVKGAKGDTPVKYIICGLGEKDCFIAARFSRLASCESHKNWSEMLCDTKSDPGKMTCTKNTSISTAVAYCTL